ncbi:Acetyl-coenzyme A synthetase [Kitasatospora sp. MMS16-BH015]|uniref:AMP-binding protein n=1 Tax=Kitasatospora sp. MMS16-BH015 TaxID=2018025 RepID=UPI000CA0D74A|nr:AMP-binding protein [Kitasatospora sp. MMS16-BH015]AUG78972.1 Acetyl-coenzyme A synthetase [Kitasatospora sp. MMS16-BH015]
MARPAGRPLPEGHGDRLPEGYWDRRRTAAHTEYRAARDLLLRLRGDQAAAHAEFRWPRAERFNWALEWFDVIAEGNHASALEVLGAPAADGSVPVAEQVSFAELSARSDALAVSLAELGVARGERVLLLLGTRVALWESLLGCLKLGAVVVPTYQDVTREEALDRITRGRIRHVLCTGELAALLDELPIPGVRISTGPARPDWHPYPDTTAHCPYLPEQDTPSADPAFCYFTSGTTSLPKLVEHTHASYPVGHLSSLYWNGLRPGDRHLNLSAPGWAKHSWSSFFVPWAAEATVLAPPDSGLPAEHLPGVLADHAVASFCAPPSAWRSLLPHLPGAGVRLREATAAGEPLTGEVNERIAAAWGVRVRDGYGQTEATALIGRSPDGPEPISPLGHPLPGYRIVLRDPATGELGDTGEVCLDLTDRPAGLMAGYAEDPVKTAAAFADGLYRTGDSGERCADGSIRLLGRTDDVFKSFGHRVSPVEIEAVLRGHPEVADAVVLPRPDPLGGLVPHAVVVPRPGAEPDHLREALLTRAADRLAPIFVPRSVEFTTELPRTRSGKVRRSELVALLGL